MKCKKTLENSTLDESTIEIQKNKEKNFDLVNEAIRDDNNPTIERKKVSKFISMLMVLFCSNSNKYKGYTDKTFATLTSLILRIFGYSLLIIDVLLLIGTPLYLFIGYKWESIFEGILSILYIIIIVIFNFLLSVLLVGTAKEQESKDYNATIPVFSAIVSFIALIISLIALIK